MISVKDLVKSYDNYEPAVKGVSFEIGKGEIVGLLGPNGAGKSTIMKMLTCYMNPTAGQIIIDGKNTMDEPLEVKKLIGYLPESSPQYEDMTVFDYLNWTAEIRGVDPAGIPAKVDEMISLTSLERVVAKKIGQLSKGYRKRVGLASVMIHDPKILILDEPTSGLDPNQIMTFRRILRRLSEKKTIILSTHVLSEIEAICERVIIINRGRIVADDTIANLVGQKYADEQLYYLRESNRYEVDFVCTQASKVMELVQVTYDFTHPSVKLFNREIGGLVKASKKTHCDHLTLIVMYGETGIIERDGKKIRVVNAADWLLGKQ